MTFGPPNTPGSYLINAQRFSKDWDTFLTQITKLYQDIARAINIREIASYDLDENVTGELWFNPLNVQMKRGGFRQVYQLGATAAGVTTTIAHGITGVNSTTTFTHIYGACVTNVIDNRPIPYSSVTAVNQQIEIKIDTTNIYVINGAGAPNITSGYLVVEYLKN